jgi:hypothetical protein
MMKKERMNVLETKRLGVSFKFSHFSNEAIGKFLHLLETEFKKDTIFSKNGIYQIGSPKDDLILRVRDNGDLRLQRKYYNEVNIPILLSQLTLEGLDLTDKIVSMGGFTLKDEISFTYTGPRYSKPFFGLYKFSSCLAQEIGSSIDVFSTDFSSICSLYPTLVEKWLMLNLVKASLQQSSQDR